MKLITNIQEWRTMTEPEREAYVFQVIGILKHELEAQILHFNQTETKSANAIFLSLETLVKLPVTLRKLCRLTVIPMDAPPDRFIISHQDPWAWGNLFYM